MIKPILLWPNPGLKVKSFTVGDEEFDTPEFNQLITDMWDTLYDSGGVGISAIQIGVPKRVFVMDVGKRSLVFVNPKIVSHTGDLAETNEGCLSLPGIVELVLRWPSVGVEALDDKGVAHTGIYVNLEGQCVQHENDHLDGIVFPDKLSSYQREKMIKRMKKMTDRR